MPRQQRDRAHGMTLTRGGLRRELPLHLMLIPAVIIVIIFSYVPMAGIVMAFQDFRPFRGWFGSSFVGLDNFRYVFEMPKFARAFENTVIISFLKIVFGLAAPITTALMLNEVNQKFIKRGVQTLIYLPHFLSWVILGGILRDILSPSSGIVNQLLQWIGMQPIYFLGDNKWFRFTLIVTDVWKEFGFSTIVYLAAITGISPALYEAAIMDGAGRWKQTLHVTLPGMVTIIVLLATLSLGNVLNAGFDQVFNLYSPIVYESGDIIDTLVYRTGIEEGKYAVSTAIGLFKSIISFALISVSYWLAYRFADYRIF